MGHFPQEGENEQNMAFFVCFTVTKRFDFFELFFLGQVHRYAGKVVMSKYFHLWNVILKSFLNILIFFKIFLDILNISEYFYLWNVILKGVQ